MQSSPYERKDSQMQAGTDPLQLATEVCHHHRVHRELQRTSCITNKHRGCQQCVSLAYNVQGLRQLQQFCSQQCFGTCA